MTVNPLQTQPTNILTTPVKPTPLPDSRKLSIVQIALTAVKVLAATALFVISCFGIFGCLLSIPLGIGGAIGLTCAALACFVIVLMSLWATPSAKEKAYQKQIDIFAAENARLKSNLSDLEKALSSLEDIGVDLDAHVKSSEDLVAQCKHILTEFNKLKSEMQEQLRPAATLVSSVSKLLTKEDIIKLTSELQDLKNKVLQTQANVVLANDLLQQTKGQVQQQQQILDLIQEQVKDLEKQKQQLQQVVSQLQQAAQQAGHAQQDLIAGIEAAVHAAAPAAPENNDNNDDDAAS
ncbi:hypothetical protein [Chlamydia pecorum]|uniref:hypothetical protein n=1 Tax=Chlamydia pecorum TaxID=85991 RepID=UPI0007AEEEC2|nr:hypothetical protein [Chlamydia pecorum]KZN27081.1 putative inclusion membrane protein A [Chlamydia pecorum]